MKSSVLVMNTNLREHLERLQHRQKGGGGEASAAGCPFVLAPLLQTNRARLMSKYARATGAEERRVDRAHVTRVRRSHIEYNAHIYIYIYMCVCVCDMLMCRNICRLLFCHAHVHACDAPCFSWSVSSRCGGGADMFVWWSGSCHVHKFVCNIHIHIYVCLQACDILQKVARGTKLAELQHKRVAHPASGQRNGMDGYVDLVSVGSAMHQQRQPALRDHSISHDAATMAAKHPSVDSRPDSHMFNPGGAENNGRPHQDHHTNGETNTKNANNTNSFFDFDGDDADAVFREVDNIVNMHMNRNGDGKSHNTNHREANDMPRREGGDSRPFPPSDDHHAVVTTGHAQPDPGAAGEERYSTHTRDDGIPRSFPPPFHHEDSYTRRAPQMEVGPRIPHEGVGANPDTSMHTQISLLEKRLLEHDMEGRRMRAEIERLRSRFGIQNANSDVARAATTWPMQMGQAGVGGNDDARRPFDYTGGGDFDAPGPGYARVSETVTVFGGDNADGGGAPPTAFEDFGDQTPPELVVERRHTQTLCVNEDGDGHAEWAHRNFEWTASLELANRDFFGNTSFRKHQREIVNANLSNRDVFVLMPTGGGKSLCYQLPAAMRFLVGTPGVTFVISPLVSLIQDQMHHLAEAGIPSASLSGKNDATTNADVKRDLKSPSPNLRLIYVTPERLAKDVSLRDIMTKLYDNNLLRSFVIDEAHCVSTWGHDFRKDYTKLHFCKTLYPEVPIMALTATATYRVQEDIKKQLGLTRCVTFRQSFNRPNLRYEVRKKGKTCMDEIIDIINQYRTRRGTHACGIVYCLSRDDCENVAHNLQQNGIRAAHYHASLTDKKREEVQADWTDDKINIICATIAFGMGINKPDVRFVIHHSISKSLEGYHQEAGRAGRDGKNARCILFYAFKDAQRIQKMTVQSGREHRVNPAQTQSHLENLRKVIAYCQNGIECRRVQLLAYFDDSFDEQMCQRTCDNCAKRANGTTLEVRDMSNTARDIVSLVNEMRPGGSSTVLIDVFRGSKAATVTRAGYNLLSYYGKGSSMSRDDCERLIQKMLIEKVLAEEVDVRQTRGDFSYVQATVHCGERADALIAGRFALRLPFSTAAKKAVVSETSRSKSRTKTSTSDRENAPLAPIRQPLACEPAQSKKMGKVSKKPAVAAPPASSPAMLDENLNDFDGDVIDLAEDEDAADGSLFDELKDALRILRSTIVDEKRRENDGNSIHARQINASNIWGNSVADAIAKKCPRHVDDLKNIDKLTKNQRLNYGERIIATINDTLEVIALRNAEGGGADGHTIKRSRDSDDFVDMEFSKRQNSGTNGF